jgi:IclR family acetate operon transcriptional repressor
VVAVKSANNDSGGQEESSAQTGKLVQLVAETLYALAERPEGASIRAIAQDTGNSRSSTHRILQYLARSGYVDQTTNGGYVVGSRLLSLAARVFGVVPVIQVARSIMRTLVDGVGETCYLATFSRKENFCTYVQRLESDHLVRHVQQLGVRIPLHAGAVGKAILAEIPDFDLASLDMVAFTPRTITSPRAMRTELKSVLKNGYAVSIEERVIGVAGVAAPVKSGDTLVGALTVSIPMSRVPKKGLDGIGGLVRKHADELSAALKSMGVQRI